MEPTRRPRIKVCCISSVEEAWIAIRAGASALGLVSAMPSGPGVIGDELIAETAARVPPEIATFLLTSAVDAESIVAQQRSARVNTLQLVDAVAEDELRRLRAELPGIALVQVIHVRGRESVEEARAVAPLLLPPYATLSVLWERQAKDKSPTREELMQKYEKDYAETADKLVRQLRQHAPG